MNKIFFYELKRMIFCRLFLVMLVINALFAWYVLTTDIIAGIAYTAPFSLWSYGAYLGKVLPLAILTILLLLSGYCGKKQKKVEELTMAAPVSPAKQMLIREAVLAACFVVLCLLLTGISLIFYVRFFRFHNFFHFALPSLLLIMPCFVFATGLGQLLGRFHQGLVFVLILLVFVVGFSGIYNVFDFFGAGYFTYYPLTLPVNTDGEPDFAVDTLFAIVRVLYFLAGTAFFVIAVRLSGQKSKKA